MLFQRPPLIILILDILYAIKFTLVLILFLKQASDLSITMMYLSLEIWHGLGTRLTTAKI